MRLVFLVPLAILCGCYSSHGDRPPAVDPTVGTVFIDLNLPATTPLGRFALVQVRDTSFRFDDAWLGRDPTFPLEAVPTARTVRQVSDDDTMDLRVKVRLCELDNCSSLEDIDARECRFEIEHPFYLGHETRVALDMPSSGCRSVPRGIPVTYVDVCEVAGCSEVPLSSYCGPDATHLCE